MAENILFLFESCDSKDFHDDKLLENISQGNWHENLNEQFLTNFLKNGSDNFTKDEKLAYAISSLLTYLENFVGKSNRFAYTFEDVNCNELIVDGVEINENIRLPECLLISKRILDDLMENYSDDIIVLIWYMRMLKVHQNSLDEQSASLYEHFQKIHSKLNLKRITNIRYRFIVQLEIISIYILYRRAYKVEELIKNLKQDYKIETTEEGILGVRTKWQEKALPQFHVSIHGEKSELFISPHGTHANTKLLKLLELEDDTRLESVKYVDEKHNELQILSSMLQNFTLLNVKYLQISQPSDKLSDEEIQPYVTLLLQQAHGPWPIRLDSLLIKIKLESNHRRTIDRCLRQCEAIINLINNDHSSDLSPTDKLSYVFSSLLVPNFKIEALLADLMVSLGLVKGALDVYLKIQQWDDVINCYTRLQLRHKAAEIIKQEIEKRPTVKLFCLLGDATDDEKCYETAWEFSKCKSGLAQRHWGQYYFGKADYTEAIPHLQKSLEINSLQENLWLRLGYAALSVENYELASSAYLRYTQLEPTGFESWNNLAKCFIKLGDKKRAHKVLQESLKCNYDNWKIWENFLLVSLDTGCFEDAINSYNRLIELKEKYFDEEVLKILVNAIAKNVTDSDGNSSIRLRKKALEMLAHVGSMHMNEGIVWELSSVLSEEPLKKAEKLQKAYKGYVSKSLNWSSNEEMCIKLLRLSHVLCVHSIEGAQKFNENEKMLVLSQLSSARLTAQGCVKAATNSQWDSCREITQEINNMLEKIVTKIKELK